MKKVVFLVTSSTYSRAREGLDLILGVSAFVENITVIFMDEGLRLLLKGCRKTELHGERDFFKTMGMLELYDITDIRVLADSLVLSEYEGCNFDLKVQKITLDDFHDLLSQSDHKITI